eukprot:GHUV01036239.1.p2 GENE.GHUV01036239.1~~GHUV01036239.1.p2  ORF type:complete len:134 (-),score=20.64 GHUV01036239.1:609-1010(-)
MCWTFIPPSWRLACSRCGGGWWHLHLLLPALAASEPHQNIRSDDLMEVKVVATAIVTVSVGYLFCLQGSSPPMLTRVSVSSSSMPRQGRCMYCMMPCTPRSTCVTDAISGLSLQSEHRVATKDRVQRQQSQYQ